MLKRTIRTLVIGLMLATLVAVLGCSGTTEETAEQTETADSAQTQDSTTDSAEEPSATADAAVPPAPQGMTDVTELKVEDLTVGTGDEAVAGKTVTVHYTGWLVDGTMFDSSVTSGQPFQFVLGQGYVIPGWDQGVAGMKVGGKRRLTIPPALGYGEAGAGGVIPPNATLVFDVELLAVQ